MSPRQARLPVRYPVGCLRLETVAVECSFCEMARQHTTDQPVQKKQAGELFAVEKASALGGNCAATQEWNLQVPR